MVKISNNETMVKLSTMRQLALQHGDYRLARILDERLKPIIKKAGGKPLTEYMK